MSVVVKYGDQIMFPNMYPCTLNCENKRMSTDIAIFEMDDMATEGLTYTKVTNGLIWSYQCDGGTVSGDMLVIPSMVEGRKVTSIGAGAFEGCDGLTSVTIGDSVTSIGDSAFWGCSGLISIVIPDSVTTFYDRPFYNCTSLVDIRFKGTMEQWNAIDKASFWGDWNANVPATKVICSDGEVAL